MHLSPQQLQDIEYALSLTVYPSNRASIRWEGVTATRARVIMSIILRRPLTVNEAVHHIDGDKFNDNPANLQLMGRGEHSRMHNLQRAENPEWAKFLSKVHSGKAISEEHKQANSKALTGRVLTEEHRTRISKALIGRSKSPETIAKRQQSRIESDKWWAEHPDLLKAIR